MPGSGYTGAAPTTIAQPWPLRVTARGRAARLYARPPRERPPPPPTPAPRPCDRRLPRAGRARLRRGRAVQRLASPGPTRRAVRVHGRAYDAHCQRTARSGLCVHARLRHHCIEGDARLSRRRDRRDGPGRRLGNRGPRASGCRPVPGDDPQLRRARVPQQHQGDPRGLPCAARGPRVRPRHTRRAHRAHRGVGLQGSRHLRGRLRDAHHHPPLQDHRGREQRHLPRGRLGGQRRGREQHSRQRLPRERARRIDLLLRRRALPVLGDRPRGDLDRRVAAQPRGRQQLRGQLGRRDLPLHELRRVREQQAGALVPATLRRRRQHDRREPLRGRRERRVGRLAHGREHVADGVQRSHLRQAGHHLDRARPGRAQQDPRQQLPRRHLRGARRGRPHEGDGESVQRARRDPPRRGDRNPVAHQRARQADPRHRPDRQHVGDRRQPEPLPLGRGPGRHHRGAQPRARPAGRHLPGQDPAARAVRDDHRVRR